MKSTSKTQSNKAHALAPILVKGAREHNLKNIDVAFPRNKLIVVTGVSGSGKSSLTMDTLFAEGQRKYAESLSAYARQFLVRKDKPDVDSIEGLSPAIAIEQKVSTRNPRSTVGTMTETQDYVRLLFARIGKTISPISGEEVKKDNTTDVVNYIQSLDSGARVFIIIPLIFEEDRGLERELNLLVQKGFVRLLKIKEDINELIRIEDLLEKQLPKKLDDHYLLIDRIITPSADDWDEEMSQRLADSADLAFYEGRNQLHLWIETNSEKNYFKTFNHAFERDGILFEEPTPHLFSFNNPLGACPECEGFGKILGINPNLVIPNPGLSVYEEGVVCWRGERMGKWRKTFILEEGKKGFPVHKPILDLSKEERAILQSWIDDFFKMVEENLYKVQYRVMQARYRGKKDCPTCQGSRLKQEALYVKVADTDINELSDMPIERLNHWFNSLTLSEHDQQIAQRILMEIEQRLKTLLNVGLGYLHLNRHANTLSGGESQRIQLTKFLGNTLTDSLYILDEPSIGLHPRDTAQLITVLKELRDHQNTVIVVEHEDLMMEEADYIIDMGPLAAHLGGEVIASGTVEELKSNPNSLTGKYLSGKMAVGADLPKNKIQAKDFIILKGCRGHNLKDIDIKIPLNMLTVVTGVSGSGKTTLIKGTLYPALQKHLGESPSEEANFHNSLEGDLKKIDQVEMVNQNPIGKSSRSNPVTYIKAYDNIRQLFADQPLSKMQGFMPKHFSFNVPGGRCETCKGEGEVIVEMQFLADVHLVCEDCKGRRFKDEVLEVRYQEKNIFDVLEMGVDEAIAFFKDHNNIQSQLQYLSDVGLGYIKLGQSSNTLSGGESQRVKLASFLSKKNQRERFLFIFDEPTTGLHFHDITKLLTSFRALIDQGHSIIVIEHNTSVIQHADWVIDIGPEGGEKGGSLLYEGPLEGLKKVKESYTAKYV